MPVSQRDAFLDSTRGLAVFLAVLIHAVRSFGYAFSPEGDLVFLLTRTATPILLIVFGVMIETVYLRKLREGRGLEETRQRLLHRAITCYLVYLMVGLAALLAGKVAVGDLGQMAVSLSPVPYGQILFLYAALLTLLACCLPVLFSCRLLTPR